MLKKKLFIIVRYNEMRTRILRLTTVGLGPNYYIIVIRVGPYECCNLKMNYWISETTSTTRLVRLRLVRKNVKLRARISRARTAHPGTLGDDCRFVRKKNVTRTEIYKIYYFTIRCAL